MAYENIDVSSLKTAISNCKYLIKYTNENEIKRNLNYSRSWNCNSKTQIITAFNDLYKKISKLNSVYINFNNLATYIEQYKKYQNLYNVTEQKLKSISNIKANQSRIYALKRTLTTYKSYMNSCSNKINNVKNTILSALSNTAK